MKRKTIFRKIVYEGMNMKEKVQGCICWQGLDISNARSVFYQRFGWMINF